MGDIIMWAVTQEVHEHSYGVVPSAHQNFPLADGLKERAPSSWSLHVLLLPIFLLFPAFFHFLHFLLFTNLPPCLFHTTCTPDICAPIVVLMHGGGSKCSLAMWWLQLQNINFSSMIRSRMSFCSVSNAIFLSVLDIQMSSEKHQLIYSFNVNMLLV